MQVAILDDYRQVSLASTDWSPVRALAEIDVFCEHVARTDALVRVLEPYDMIVAMRSGRTSTRPGWASCRGAAAGHHGHGERLDRPGRGGGTGVTVCGTAARLPQRPS